MDPCSICAAAPILVIFLMACYARNNRMRIKELEKAIADSKR